MSEQIKILSKDDKKAIINEVKQFMIESGNFDLSIYIKQLNDLYKEMEMAIEISEKYNPYIQKKQLIAHFSKELQRKQYLMAKGYLLIFTLREYLLNEKIGYRYYLKNQDGDGVDFKDFSTLQLLDLMTFEKKAIGLSESKIKDAKQNLNQAQLKMQQMVSATFKDYTSSSNNQYFRELGYYNLRQVKKSIMNQYYPQNPALRKKSSRAKYQTFNEGHILESLDITFSYLFSQEVYDPKQEEINKLFFGKFLARDNILASKAPDNIIGMTQIKSSGASLYNFNTIAKQIYLLYEMFNKLSPEKIEERIKYLYIDNTKNQEVYQQLGKDLEEQAKQAYNKIEKYLLENLKLAKT